MKMQIMIEYEPAFGKHLPEKYTVRREWGTGAEEPNEFYMQTHAHHEINGASVYLANEANIDVTHQPFVDAINTLVAVPTPSHDNYPEHGKLALAEHDAKLAVIATIVHPTPQETISNDEPEPTPEYECVHEGSDNFTGTLDEMVEAARSLTGPGAPYEGESVDVNQHQVGFTGEPYRYFDEMKRKPVYANCVFVGDDLFAQPMTHEKPTTILNEVITVSEASQLFNRETSVIRRACEQSKVLCRKSGREWLIQRSSAEARWGENTSTTKQPRNPRSLDHILIITKLPHYESRKFQ